MKDNRWTIGVDLGKLGGICFMLDGEIIETHAMPLDEEGELNIKRLQILLDPYRLSDVMIIFEKITPLHLASAKSNWSLALQGGAIEALCIAMDLPYNSIPPKEWQKYMFKKLPPLRTEKGSSDTKGLALITVKILFPEQILTDPLKPKATVPHDGIVDSICLAYFGYKNFGNYISIDTRLKC